MALQLGVDLVEDLRLLHGHVRVGGGEVHPHQPVTDNVLYRKTDRQKDIDETWLSTPLYIIEIF
jgi:hypothetical protein